MEPLFELMVFTVSVNVLMPDCVPVLPECRTAMPADVVFLVDESWSVGPSSFRQIKEFTAEIIRSFKNSVTGPEGVRFGVTVYGDVPR